MNSDYSDSSGVEEECQSLKTTKKRKKSGNMSHVMKKLRASTHELGGDCNCVRYHCFQTVTLENRMTIIRQFNELGNYDDQNKYLGGLIAVLPVQRRRGRKDDSDTRFNHASYAYRVRANIDGAIQDIRVCYKAFMAIHGVSASRIQHIRESLAFLGEVRPDQRGKHGNHWNKLPEETTAKIEEFLASLKGRKSHYSLHDSKKIYLPEDLNIKKLFDMYTEKNVNHKVSYEKFRNIFETKFNIAFGYPRKDTCSTCDVFKVELTALETKLTNCSDDNERKNVAQKLEVKSKEKVLHLKKAEKFYSLKRKFRKNAQRSHDMEAIVIDFQKNLPCPNISTNDVYYRRQLNFISFTIHVLSNSKVVFYTYDESVAKKGADDVCSMLNHFLHEILSPEVRNLAIFCDSCAGQNKNYTLIRYYHHIVRQTNRFDNIKVIFPVRGHSYLECDRDMSLVNQKTITEMPEDWREVLRNSRKKSPPFLVIDCSQEIRFETWTQYLSTLYCPKCPFPTRPVRILKFEATSKNLVFYKTTFYGSYLSASITPRAIRKRKPTTGSTSSARNQGSGELRTLYAGNVPIKAAKYRDLQHLKQFLTNPSARDFYDNLIPDVQNNDEDPEYIDDPPIDDED